MLVVEEKSTDKIEFVDESGKGIGSYFEIWHELPYEGYLDYLDSAMNITVDPKTNEPTAEAKFKLGQISNVLIQNGFISLENVKTSAGRVLTKEDYKLLPFTYLQQIVKAIQIRNMGDVQNPNALVPTAAS